MGFQQKGHCFQQKGQLSLELAFAAGTEKGRSWKMQVRMIFFTTL